MPAAMAATVNVKMPMGLPTNSASAVPNRDTADDLGGIEPRYTHEFARANKGMMPNATQG